MQALDYVILICYFLLVLMISGIFGRSQKSLKDYFLGSRDIPWWAAAFSGIATVASPISYIGAVGLGYSSNLFFLQYRLALPFSILIISLIILPFFYNLHLYSIYEYLEKRFGLTIRLICSALFIIFKCCYLAIVIYAPVLIIQQMTGSSNVIQIVLLTGLITTLYTLIGGMKAVIWTDTLQLFILLGGIFFVIWTGLSNVDGGMKEVLAIGRQYGKFDYFNFSPDFSETYTLWGGIIGGTFLMVSQFGTDQAEMQRFLTVDSLKKSRLALIVSLLVATCIGFLIFFEGGVIFSFYHQKGIPEIASNHVFIKFVVEELPVGVRGFLVAAIFAAAMGATSSVLNSLTTVVLTDFYNRFNRKGANVTLARIITFALGTLSTVLACLGKYLGNILEISTTIINFFGGALIGVFLLGMLSRKAGTKGALAGFIAGIIIVSLIAFLTHISFMWYSVIGAFTTYFTGIITSYFLKEKVPLEKISFVYSRKGYLKMSA